MRAALIVCVFCVLLVFGSTRDDKCFAHDNKWWDKTREKCRKCKGCVSGQARNFTEPFVGPTGSEGDYGCLPCQKPPPGFYINIYSDRSPPEFVKCKDCAGLHRNMDVFCGTTFGGSCGGCFPGFVDNGSGNTDFPCITKTTTASTTTKMPPTTNVTKTSNGTLKGNHTKPSIPIVAESKENHGSAPSRETEGVAYNYVIVISCVLGGTLFLTGFVVYVYRKRRMFCKKRVTNIAYNQSLNDNDLEMDTNETREVNEPSLHGYKIGQIPASATGKSKLYHLPNKKVPSGRAKNPSTSHEVEPLVTGCSQEPAFVRGELQNSRTDLLPGNVQLSVDELRKLLGLGKPWSRLCDCHYKEKRLPKCNYSHIPLLGRNDIFQAVSNEICHDPTKLFITIKVPNSIYYQINDDRDRNPEGMSQNELIYKVLQRWVQVKGKEATLQVLIKGLHSAQFYHIIEQVTQLKDHEKRYPTTEV